MDQAVRLHVLLRLSSMTTEESTAADEIRLGKCVLTDEGKPRCSACSMMSARCQPQRAWHVLRKLRGQLK
eukprot:4648543-Pleurochrysis_carterae.AAC.8